MTALLPAASFANSLAARAAAALSADFVKIVSEHEQPELVLWRNSSGAGNTIQLFLRSRYSSWAAHPAYVELLESATPLGSRLLQSWATVPAYRPGRVGEHCLLGPGVSFDQRLGNTALRQSLTNRIKAVGVNSKRPASLVRNSQVIPLAEWVTTANHQFVVDSLTLLGYEDIVLETSIPYFHSNTGPSAPRDPVFGYGKQIVSPNWGTTPMYVPGKKTVLAVMNYGGSVAVYRVRDDWSSEVPVFLCDGNDVPALDWLYAHQACFAEVDKRYSDEGWRHMGKGTSNHHSWAEHYASGYNNAMNALNAWRAENALLNSAYGEPLPLVANYAEVTSGSHQAMVANLDDFYLPVVTLPGAHEFFLRAPIETMTVSTEHYSLSDAPTDVATVVTVGSAADDIAGAVPIAWYFDYLQDGFGLRSGGSPEKAAAAVALMGELSSYSMTFVGYSEPVELPENVVRQLAAYRDYGKAREKNCQDNNFLELEYDSGITWKTVENKMNASRSLSVLYGYRESGAHAPALALDTSMKTYTLTVSMPIRVDGVVTVSPEFEGRTTLSATDVADIVTLQASGAVLVGNLDAQLRAWSIPADDVAYTVEDMAQVSGRVKVATSAAAIGTALDVYSFSWASLGLSGFPDVKSLGEQPRYRACIRSVVTLAPKFGLLKTAAFDFVSEALFAAIVAKATSKK